MQVTNPASALNLKGENMPRPFSDELEKVRDSLSTDKAILQNLLEEERKKVKKLEAERKKVKKLEAELIHNEGCYVDAIGEYRLEEQDLRKKIKKLEGWLIYLWRAPWYGQDNEETNREISDYVKAVEEKP